MNLLGEGINRHLYGNFLTIIIYVNSAINDRANIGVKARRYLTYGGEKMDWMKILGYILYAIGIVGGVQGVLKKSVWQSVVAIAVIVVGSFLLGMDKKEKSVS